MNGAGIKSRGHQAIPYCNDVRHLTNLDIIVLVGGTDGGGGDHA